VTAPRLAEFVKKDPVLASSVLRVANSALYGGRIEITDLAFAMTRIGLNQARNLVFANVLRSKMADPQVYGEHGRRLMDHALATAFGAQMVADRVPRIGEDAFLCGLLHDFGRLALLKVLRQSQGYPESGLPEDQQELIERYHAPAGALLAKSWGLPEVVAQVARYHHEIEDAPEEDRPLVAAVSFSDTLAHALGLGDKDIPLEQARQHSAVRLLGLGANTIDDTVEMLPKLFQTARSSMGT
jgi:putative nucleotidyltransferase with HDIG domain